MPRTFIYARVSTTEQNPENQIQEIQAAGFEVKPHRIVQDMVSGNVPMASRKGFSRLLEKMENGDVLIVTKLDRLGRNAVDVTMTIQNLAALGIKVHCLALGGVDLTSSAGAMTMGVINAVAQFERDLLIERTQAGLNRAKASGRKLGRPTILSNGQREIIQASLASGESISALARQFNVSRQTIMRIMLS